MMLFININPIKSRYSHFVSAVSLPNYFISNSQFERLNTCCWVLNEVIVSSETKCNSSLLRRLFTINPAINFIIRFFCIVGQILQAWIFIFFVCYHTIDFYVAGSRRSIGFLKDNAPAIPVNNYKCYRFFRAISLKDYFWLGIANNKVCLSFRFISLLRQVRQCEHCCYKRSGSSDPTTKRTKPVSEANCLASIAPFSSDKRKVEQPYSYEHSHASRCKAGNKATVFTRNHFDTFPDYCPLNSTVVQILRGLRHDLSPAEY